MPIHGGKNKKGNFVRWGRRGKKYYYESGNKSSERRARKKARKQAKAAYASGYKHA
jgi:hypothetical protein